MDKLHASSARFTWGMISSEWMCSRSKKSFATSSRHVCRWPQR